MTVTDRPAPATRRAKRRARPAVTLPTLPAPLRAGPDDPTVHQVRAALDLRLRALLAHDPGVRDGTDIEDVHQMRVAVRRMRATLRSARPVLDAPWADGLRAELGWLGRSLGPVRDLDVMLPRLRGLARELTADPVDADPADGSAEPATAAEELLALAGEGYPRAREEMLAALSAPRYAALLEKLADAVRLPLPTPSATTEQPELGDVVRGEYRSLHRAVRRAGKNPPDEVLHDLRVRGKRLRYTGELAEPTLGKPVRRLLGATAELQEVLGDHQDACVARQHLADLVAGFDRADRRVPAGVAFLAGRMAEREAERARRQRELWWPAWKQVRARGREL